MPLGGRGLEPLYCPVLERRARFRSSGSPSALSRHVAAEPAEARGSSAGSLTGEWRMQGASLAQAPLAWPAMPHGMPACAPAWPQVPRAADGEAADADAPAAPPAAAGAAELPTARGAGAPAAAAAAGAEAVAALRRAQADAHRALFFQARCPRVTGALPNPCIAPLQHVLEAGAPVLLVAGTCRRAGQPQGVKPGRCTL